MHNIIAETKGVSFIIWSNNYSYSNPDERWNVTIKGEIEGLKMEVTEKGPTIEGALAATVAVWNIRTRGIAELNPALTYEPSAVDYRSDEDQSDD